MKKHLVRNIIIIVVLLAVVALILKRTGALGGHRGEAVETSKVSKQTIIETVNASGKIQPATEVKISADISGEIIALPVKEGDNVKKGDLLVRIKPDQYQRAVEKSMAGLNSAQAAEAQAKASLAQSQAAFEKSKHNYQRNKDLYAQNAISQADFQAIESEFKVSQAQLEGARENVKAAQFNIASAQAALRESQDALKKTAVYSPINGTISKLNVELGERVVGTMQMAGTEMMRVADLADMQVEVDVNENDIVRLAMNDTAIIDVDAYRDRSFKGLVKEIASSSETTLGTEKVTNFTVKIRILPTSYQDMNLQNSNIPTPFRPGMTANVTIQTKRAENVMAVPILAVTVRRTQNSRDTASAENDQEVVFLLKDGKAVQTPVKTGIQDDMYIQILNGLQEGQTVISGPYRVVSKELNDGQSVQTLDRKDKNAGKD